MKFPSSKTTGVNLGFTLIEILIVMVIISIVSGIALLTITNNPHKQIENFAHQLTNLITLAKEEAMLRPATLGLAFTQTSFQFFGYKNKTTEDESPWQPLNDRNLGLRSLPSQIQITLKIQNKSAALSNKPQIIISESGDITPFVIFIGKKGEGAYYQIKGDANGQIKSEAVREE